MNRANTLFGEVMAVTEMWWSNGIEINHTACVCGINNNFHPNTTSRHA